MKLGIIGDIHGFWGPEDVKWFNESDRDAILFTGDLAGFRHEAMLRVARSIGELEKPAILVPGNHAMILDAEYYEGYWSDWSPEREDPRRARAVAAARGRRGRGRRAGGGGA